MRQNTYLMISLVLVILVIMISGCSSSIKSVKPGVTETDKSTLNDTPVHADRAASSINLTFPFSNDQTELCRFQSNAYRLYLAESIRFYRRATGTYPDSMESYVRSGFPLHWPRNIMTGEPAGVLVDRAFNLDKSDFGLIKWEKFDDDNAKLTFVDIDYNVNRGEGSGKWVENYIAFRWRDWVSYRDETLDDYRRASNAGLRPGDDDKEKSIDVIGGTIPINAAMTVEHRKVYGMCGQLHARINRAARGFFYDEQNHTIPTAFSDFYSGFHNIPGYQNEHGLIILENFADFAAMLKSSGADFKIGFDENKNAQYTWLKIDDETLIAYCIIYDLDNTFGVGSQYLGIALDENGINVDPDYSYFRKMANMSSPMITVNNIDQLEIPGEISISVADIPLGE